MIFGKDMSTLRKLMLLKAATGGAPLNEYEASGNPLTFNTNKAKPLRKALATWTPQQEGTGDPSPSNVRPISGMSGVNVWHTGKNMFYINGNEMVSDGWNRYFPNPITKAGTYKFSCVNKWGGTGQKGGIVLVKNKASNAAQAVGSKLVSTYAFGNGAYSVTITVTEEQAKAKYIEFACNSEGTTADSLVNAEFQLEVGEERTAYEPYVGESISVTFPALGKNLFSEANGTFGKWTNSSGVVSDNNGGYISADIPVEGGQTYTLSYNGTKPYSASIVEYSPTGTFVKRDHTSFNGTSSFSVTLDSATSIVRVQVFAVLATDTQTAEMLASEQIQFEKGSSATAYEPYTTTVYGGSLDLVTGVLTAEWGCTVFNGSETGWEKQPTGSAIAFAMRYIFPESMFANTPSFETNYLAVIQPSATWGNYDNWISWVDNKTIVTGIQSITTVEAWETYLAEHNLQIVYKLATPQTYQLIPQQITAFANQINTIWSDANGDCEVTYLKKG